jgi:hypothetical protein
MYLKDGSNKMNKNDAHDALNKLGVVHDINSLLASYSKSEFVAVAKAANSSA